MKWFFLSKNTYRYSRELRIAALFLACVVAFTTTYALILPAISMDEDAARNDPAVFMGTVSPTPTAEPTSVPTAAPTAAPSPEPTAEPTPVPSPEAAPEPTPAPTAEAAPEPTPAPTAEAAPELTPEPTAELTPSPASAAAPAAELYPAQAFRADVGENWHVEIKAPEGALPQGAKLVFRSVDEYADAEAVRLSLSKEAAEVRLFDLYFTNGSDARLQLLEKVHVSLRGEALREDKDAARLLRLDAEHHAESIKLLRETVREDELTFETNKLCRIALVFVAAGSEVPETGEIIATSNETEETSPNPAPDAETAEAPTLFFSADPIETPESTDVPEEPAPDEAPAESGEAEAFALEETEEAIPVEESDESGEDHPSEAAAADIENGSEVPEEEAPAASDEGEETDEPETAEENEDEEPSDKAEEADGGEAAEEAEEIEEAEALPMPASTFTGMLDSLTVYVEADEGTFPEGTVMFLEWVTAEEVLSTIGEAVDGVVAEIRAVDITFRDPAGNELEPLKEIRVSFRDTMIKEAESIEVVHVDDNNSASVVAQDNNGTEEDEIAFVSDSFSVYGYVSIVIHDTVLASDGETYTITVTCPPEAGIPSGATLLVRELDRAERLEYLERISAALARDAEDLAYLKMLDITILHDGKELQPAAPVEVKIELADTVESNPLQVVHFGEQPELVAAESAESAVSFSAEGFSVYAIVGTTIEKTVLASDGHNYSISVTYGPEAGVPENAELSVEELDDTTEEYYNYISMTQEALGWTEGSPSYARLFDIKIVDAEGNKVEIAAPVDVRIALADKADHETQVVHFADGAAAGEIVKTVAESDGALTFAANGFSAYAIVEGPVAVPQGWSKAASLEELASLGPQGLYIGHPDGYYFTTGITQINNKRTGITKTKPAQSSPAGAAAVYYFEPVSGGANQYKVYCLNGDTRQYVAQSGNSLGFTTEDQASVFTAETFGSEANTFRLKGSDGYYWNMQAGAGGASFAAYNNASDVNAKLFFWYYNAVDHDLYELDGRSYGLMSWADAASGKAMMASQNGSGLSAKAMTVMTKAGDDSDKLFVPVDSDIPFWSFEWIGQDLYHLKTSVNGSTKYLRVDANGLSLVSEPDEHCRIQVVPGEGAHAGEICLKSGNTTLTYSGDVSTGFSVGGSVGNEWLRLVESSELTSDYFRTYSASKVSVSDKSVTTGSKVVVFTRSWNDKTKRYDFYAIGPDGKVVPCYESGDSIEWVGGQFNELLWQFTEYTNDDGTPNNYYELYNEYSGKYLTPQQTGSQILSSEPIGINMNGRRNGQYYSQIVAWDDASYSYTGLKVENGQIVTCPRSEAMDFYFAVMEDTVVDDTLHTVPTVDNNQYGITMRIKDFKTRKEMSDYLGSDAGGAGTALQQGLLSTALGEDGFPTTAGGSLGGLYSGAQEVNHLFVASTYFSSGYYEYDSTQNFATLKGNTGGDFTVYKELGSYDSGGNKPTLKHGQFFPFNDIEPGVFASVNGKNLYSATANPLPNTDPRKNESLYLIKDADCFFGVDLEASFTQTPSGLDAWGHDIIFEFTGDDDFWLYVDGELVIDLGGIHSAVPGTVNFRTGEVNVCGQLTTLRDLFYENYLGRDGHTEAEAQAYVDDLFVQNENGQWVFKDYSNHTMRIFYMERGAGASNLHMRFNLAAVQKGTVLLSKELEGVDPSESVLAEFPYQILYKTADGSEHYLTNATKDASQDIDDHVFYSGTTTPVKYQSSLTIDEREYTNVFFLTPGQTAEIQLPEEAESYRIVECGVDTSVYSDVKVNDMPIAGTPTTDDRSDYGIDYASSKDRARVRYTNVVDPDAMRTLTFTKKLYDESGTTEVSGDTAPFSFRLYLGTEYEEDLPPANMHTYYVKDPLGHYCRWDPDAQTFVSIGKSDYSTLSAAEKTQVSFSTSLNGAISRIPSFYTVEVRSILAGTRFGVQERPREIPDGYSFQKYTYQSEDSFDAEAGVTDTVSAGSDPHVDICNLKGWGLRVNKVWSDANYMAEREATYFGVYIRGEDDRLTLFDGSLRQLKYSDAPQTLYWYFNRLQSGATIDDYVIMEARVTDPVIDSDGYVTSASSVEPIDEGGAISLVGKQKGESESSPFDYTVLYTRGEISPQSNVRVDTVTNNRPGIVLKKQDWSGRALAGASFVLKDENGAPIDSFVSDADGLITVAFLRDDVPYTLTETAAPAGYHGLEADMTILLSNGHVTVSGVEEDYYLLGSDGGTPTLAIRNRPFTFRAVKLDGADETPLSGVTFALHRQVTVDGHTNFDVNPMPGYEELVSDTDGTISRITNALPVGVYELREKATPDGFQALSDYIHFSISETGVVRLLSAPEGVTLAGEPDASGTIPYVLTVRNYPLVEIILNKVAEDGSPLSGARFELTRYNGAAWEAVTSVEGVVDMESSASVQIPGLTVGRFRLAEIKAPTGYVILKRNIYFTLLRDGSIRLTDENGENESLSQDDASADNTGSLAELTVTNHAGVALPNTGGAGTLPLRILGAMLTLTSLLALARRRRRETA